MYKVSDIAAWIGAHCIGPVSQSVKWLLTDSRSLCFPENTLFFALKTKHGDGHRFIEELYARGVRSFVVQDVPIGDFPDANFLLVQDTLMALQRLAERHRETYDIPVIGITGSNGKTTVKEWLHQLLSPNFVVTRSPRSYNSQIGVPLSVWGLWKQSQIGIFEAAISEQNEMQALERVIQPTIGVLTCLGSAHQENFESMEQKCIEKLQLFSNAEVLVYPEDDEVVSRCIKQFSFRGKLLPWHSTGDALGDNKTICRMVCEYLGLDAHVIDERLKHLEPVAMRLEVKAGIRGCTIINDSYNNDCGSLDIALDFMNRRTDVEGKSRTLILSDILQSGMPASMLYTRLAEMVSVRGIDTLLAVGEGMSSCRSYFRQLPIRQEFFVDTDALLNSETFHKLENQVVLVKGARNFHFERVIEVLEQKVHETILEVNLSAVVQNLRYYRSFLHPQTRMICMIKADAYGTGAVEIAKTLQEHRVDYLAVAVADEGIALRQAGITGNIMIMNPEMSSLRALFHYHLEPEVYSFRLLKALVRAAESEGITDFPIHIKMDTGMHRMGFHPINDMEELSKCLHQQVGLTPRSVFSHFVGSDSDDFDSFSEVQYQLFMQGCEKLQSSFQHHILRHICNSAGIEHFPDKHLDMVRLGLGLYGINSRNGQLIHNVSTLRTTILQIHDVPAGESVGYSRRTVLARPSRVASIPIGYADGLNRRLGNSVGYCLVHGKPAPYIGNICMDVCMIDVTDIPCSEGDSVLIFGEELSPAQIADAIGTIPYEVLTGISNRVKRVYYQE